MPEHSDGGQVLFDQVTFTRCLVTKSLSIPLHTSGIFHYMNGTGFTSRFATLTAISSASSIPYASEAVHSLQGHKIKSAALRFLFCAPGGNRTPINGLEVRCSIH